MTNINFIQQLKKTYVTREVGQELVLVPLAVNVSQMNELFTMNETGKFIWENSNEDTSIDDLVSRMSDSFHVDPAVAKQDIIAFLNQLSTILT